VKSHQFGFPSPYRKIKELNAKLRLLKKKRADQSSGSISSVSMSLAGYCKDTYKHAHCVCWVFSAQGEVHGTGSSEGHRFARTERAVLGLLKACV